MKTTPRLAAALLTLAAILALPLHASAEQMQRLGPFEAHYALVPSTFFKREIAERYAIVRGRDRFVVNISVLDASGRPVPATLTGTATNLLGQITDLEFREIREGEAIYYLAEVRASHGETLRIRADIVTPDGTRRTLAFQQQVFHDE